MRWPWRRQDPVDPRHGRLPDGRLIDGDTVRPEGMDRLADLLDGYSAASGGQTSRESLTEHTRLLPVITPAARLRGEGGGWR